jgi:hypothetical protein
LELTIYNRDLATSSIDVTAKFLRVSVAVQSRIPRNSAISSLEHWLQRSKSNVSSETHFLGSVATSPDLGHRMRGYVTDK